MPIDAGPAGDAPGIGALRFSVLGWEPDGDPTATERAWTRGQGDRLSLTYAEIAPPVSRDMDADALRDWSVARADESEAKLVEFATRSIATFGVARTILKRPQEVAGLTYVGILTVPLRSCIWDLRVTCPELGITGIREAILLDAALQRASDPTANLEEIMGSVDADNVRYDAMFPDHPLSRVRTRLGALQASIYMDPAIAADAILPAHRSLTVQPAPWI